METIIGIILLVIASKIAHYHSKVISENPIFRPQITKHPLFNLGIMLLYISLGILGVYIISL